MDSATVEAVLRYYPAPFRSRSFCLPPDGPGFSGAIVLRVETEVGPFCLRGWPPEADAERIGGLHRLLNHVCSRGIDFVAVPVASSDGRTLVSVGGRWWQLEPWMPGRADFSSQPSDARLTAAVTSLARLHVALASFEPVGADKTWFSSGINAMAPAVSERFARLQSWTPDKLAMLETGIQGTLNTEPRLNAVATRILEGFKQCSLRVSPELRAALPIRVAVQPCFRDVWHDHILFDGNGVSGIIDPAAARTDTVAADISRLLGSLIADDARAWDLSVDGFQSVRIFRLNLTVAGSLGIPLAADARSWYSALIAYQAVRRLSPEEMRLIGILDRSGILLSGMTWLARRFFANTPFEQPERVVTRMEDIAKRLERLAKRARSIQ
jgi:Ser/Thr protein kinase RdoA (MazF antagonist)